MRTLLASLLILWLIAVPGHAQNKNPIDIGADVMRVDQQDGVVVFEGNVQVEQGDVQIWSDRLTIHYKKNGGSRSAPAQIGGDTADISKIVAEDNVVIKQGGREGTCGLASYYMDKELLVMERNPVLKEGKNVVTGKIVNMDLKNNLSEVVGGEGKRVRATFFTPKEEETPETFDGSE
jgi:lipopolysaccharide export system protein LptA